MSFTLYVKIGSHKPSLFIYNCEISNFNANFSNLFTKLMLREFFLACQLTIYYICNLEL